jgi:GNAT superfamily N-acetyltransferase
MIARLALDTDEDAVIDLARMQVAETLPHLDFDEAITRGTFKNYLETASPTIFVVEEQRTVIGFLLAMAYPYAFTRGHFTGQEVVYVRPDKRGTRAAARLFDIYDQWIDQVGAREGYTGVANGRKVEKFTKFMKRRGYEIVGASFRRITGV